MNKRVLVLLYNKFTNDSRVLKECTTLIEAGYYVELWAVYDHKLPESEVVCGIVVKRKFRKPKHGKMILVAWAIRKSIWEKFIPMFRPVPWVYKILKGSLEATENLAKQTLSSLKKIKPQSKSLAQKGEPQKFPFDIIHCNDLLPLPYAVEIKKKNPHVKIVYDCHEYETEAAGVVQNPAKKKEYEKMERENILFTDQVIVVSPSIGDEYKRLYSLDHVYLVKNTPELSINIPPSDHFRTHFGLKENDIIFLYQGGLVKGYRGIEETIKAFVQLNKEGFAHHHIVFMGYGNFEFEIQEYAHKYSNIHFHKAVKPHEIPSISSSADYGIIFIGNHCKSYDFSLPNKLFEYMMCGLPVIASPLFEIKKLVEAEKIGFITTSFEEQSLFETLKQVQTRPLLTLKKHIQSLHAEKYNWNIEKKNLIKVYEDLN